MPVPAAYVHCGIGLVTILVSVPLVLRKVSMNRWYGIRVSKAFVSSQNWYAINAYGGRLFLWYGIGLLAFGVLVGPHAPPPESPWSGLFIGGPLLALVPVVRRINVFARRFPG